ncbi:hypothetical protein QTI66_31850 [Variovorax sp. J22R133]|uniref:hypothetical protein n=1 Tax=Variovorax brevis TaxID=3053503 RepID=UPI0025789006|nr:hypothetical protein [Variovorax sp. J22R133]MDM0116732.1 hypothetical protein [Variovorax sp. J22R133]
MKLSRAKLRRLIGDATVEAYNDSEQRVGFLIMIQENLQLPFKTYVLGIEVLVERVDMTASEQIVAMCRNGRTRQRIQILDLPLPSPLPRGRGVDRGLRHWDRSVN